MSTAENTLVVVENDDGSAIISEGAAAPAPAPAPAPPPAPAEDEAIRTGGADGEDGDEAAELAAASNDAEREAIRARRRVERQNRRQRRRDAFEDLRAQLAARDRLIDDLRTRVDGFERRTANSDIAAIDARITRGESDLTYLQGVIADGTKVNNGEAVAAATLQMTQLQQDLTRLRAAKQQLATRRPEQPQLDPRMVVNAAAWMRENPWYDPNGGDPDSQQVLAIDQRLAAAGLDPNYPEYWRQLSSEVARVVPHRGGAAPSSSEGSASLGTGYNGDASRGKPRSVAVGSGAESAAAVRPGAGFRLSPERVQALKDAGMWDDPVARERAIRNYRNYDAQSASRSG